MSMRMRILGCLSFLLIHIADAAEQVTYRDALLCEARKRIDHWYKGGARKTQTMYSNKDEGIELRFLDGLQQCNGQGCVIVVGNITIPGIKPVHAFISVADVKGQAKWYSQAKDAEQLQMDLAEGVRGMNLTYSASPLSDRLAYEWETYYIEKGATYVDAEELWYVASTESGERLKKLDTEKVDPGFLGLNLPVDVGSCLSAYHFRYLKDTDSVHVTMTTHINAKVPFNIIPPSQFTSLTWGKTVEFLKQLKTHATELSKRDQGSLKTPPAEMTPVALKAPVAPTAGASCKSMADETPFHVISFAEPSVGEAKALRAAASSPFALSWAGALLLMACLMLASLLVVATLARRTGRTLQSIPNYAEVAPTDQVHA